ncbi:hypothetical protein ZWY2020_026533 [Hordeum vulgare]|nr:hypothetical protein ZWY2020_026533 [Hordeum vulgare]
MPLRRLCLFGLFMGLLLVVAYAGGRGPPPQAADGGCYKTVTGVPSSCAGQFIRALFSGSVITDFCCGLLACVAESTCASVLHGVCPYPEKNLPCPPHQAGRVYHRHG